MRQPLLQSSTERLCRRQTPLRIVGITPNNADVGAIESTETIVAAQKPQDCGACGDVHDENKEKTEKEKEEEDEATKEAVGEKTDAPVANEAIMALQRQIDALAVSNASLVDTIAIDRKAFAERQIHESIALEQNMDKMKNSILLDINAHLTSTIAPVALVNENVCRNTTDCAQSASELCVSAKEALEELREAKAQVKSLKVLCIDLY